MSDKDKKGKLQASKKDIEDGKSLAWLSYLWLLFLVPLLVNPDNSFCKHHAKQGLVLFLFWIGFFIVGIIPFLYVIRIIGYIVITVIAIIGIVQSLSGNYWKAPLGIYDLSQKFNI
jgi:uncharacterized membrane protein